MELPTEIRLRAEQIMRKQRPDDWYNIPYCDMLWSAIALEDTEEGFAFWYSIYEGDFSVYYDRYPLDDTLENVFKL
jgi:hypothetical protein